MPEIQVNTLINAEAIDIFNLARKQEDFPMFMKDVESVSILETEGNKIISEWVFIVDGDTLLMWTEEDIFDVENLTIHWNMIEGDLDKYVGKWRFIEHNNGKTTTEVIMEIEYDFGMPSLTELIGPTLELKVKENAEMMLSGLKNKIENKSSISESGDSN